MDPALTDTDQYKVKLVLKYSLIATGAYVVIFVIMRLLGLHDIVELRGLNYIVLFIVAAIAIKKYQEDSQGRMSYLQGFLTAFFITSVSYTFFPFLIYLYLKFIERAFLEVIIGYAPMGFDITPLGAALLLFFEGHAVGIVTALILMQYFKKDINKISREI